MGELTWKKWVLLKEISVRNLGKKYYQKELAELIGTEGNNPLFCDSLNILVDEGIVIKHKGIGNSKIIEIDIPELDKFLESTEIFKHFREFIKRRKIDG